MALMKSRHKAPDAAPVHPEIPRASLVASAAKINLEGQGWRSYKFGDDSWQQEAWRLYDIIGELRFVANWIGSALSQVRIYVAEVDRNGRVQRESERPKIASLADSLFGSPSSKAEAMRMLGINLTIAGDAYIVGRGADGSADLQTDEWFVVSCSELKRWGGNVMQLYSDGTKETLKADKDLVIRVWTPHPRRNLWADSPTRAAMPMLWEIERLTRFVFAQIDSRLVSAGMIPIPKEISFPDSDETGGAGLTEVLMKTGSASLKGEGTAAGVVPTFVEMPMEALGKINLIQFTSELSQQALELRKEAIGRFALAMDIEPSVLTGVAGANHWGAWQIVEGQIKIHIEPLMKRICDALTIAYLKPALKAVKEDPERFIFWYDTAPLTFRPQRLTDTLNLYNANPPVVNAEAVRLAGDYSTSDAPSDAELATRYIRELILRDPTLFQNAEIRRVAGFDASVLPANLVIQGQPGAGPPAPPVPPTGIQATEPPPLPVDSTAQNAPGGPVGGGQGAPPAPNPPPPSGLTASSTRVGDVDDPWTILIMAHGAVLRAMEIAGKRTLTASARGQHMDVPAYELHTRTVVADRQRAASLLAGAWDQLLVTASMFNMSVPVEDLQHALNGYCTTLLMDGVPHRVDALRAMLMERGFIHGQS